MKKTGRIISILLAAIMLAGMMGGSVLADENGSITVCLRIEGLIENIYDNTAINIAAGATVEDLIKQINNAGGAPKILINNSAYGAYISEVDGLSEFEYGEMSGWSYRVNDTDPMVGISQYRLKDRDSVVLFYGDPYGVGMQYPKVSLSRLLSDGLIGFSSVDSVYDEDWVLTLVENPVVGAKVVFRWGTYFTDEKGEITITDKTGLSGYRTLQIERYDEQTGVPTVLRFGPGFEIYVPFADTPHDAPLAWYEDAVRFCVREELFFGTNPTANLFEPNRKMTMTQLVSVLARIGGVDADLTLGEWWYKVPLEWAIGNGVLSIDVKIIEGGIGDVYELTSGMNVTREEFIYMFYLTAGLTGCCDMSARADISEAADYNDITAEYLEAVSWAVESGIIKGTNPDLLEIDPGQEINRATVCQMLHNYYSVGRGLLSRG